MVYIFLADGFEIIEALAPVDMLRRAKIEVKTVGVTGEYAESSCGVIVKSDILLNDVEIENANAIILPGGMPGTVNLENSKEVQSYINYCSDRNILICAICAAPSILGHKNLLNGKEATAYPGFDRELNGAKLSEKLVVRDGNFITARGAGVATEFGLKIVSALKDEETALNVKKAIQSND